MITKPLRTTTPRRWPLDATPYDVHCVERERFPMPVSRSRWADRLTLCLISALGGVLTTLIALGLVINLGAP